MSAPKFRPMTFGVTRVVMRDGAPGTRYMHADQPLRDYPQRLTDRLKHWAETDPQRSFIARVKSSTLPTSSPQRVKRNCARDTGSSK